MDDKGHCKVPPAPPTDALPLDRSGSQENMVKGKKESPSDSVDSISERVASSLVLQDGPRSDDESVESVEEEDDDVESVEEEDDDDLLLDVLNKSWELPQPSGGIQNLMRFCPVVHIEKDEYNKLCQPWNTALIITVLEKKFNDCELKEHLKRIWGIPEFEILGLGNNYFSIRFTDTENWAVYYKKVLFGGPWVVSEHCVLVQRWTPYFDPYQNHRRRIATWVRVSRIPLHFYNEHSLSKFGDVIGKTLKIDLNTLPDYSARIFVEVDVQNKLATRLIAANEVFNVEYETLDFTCFHCGKFGHRQEHCPKCRFY